MENSEWYVDGTDEDHNGKHYCPDCFKYHDSVDDKIIVELTRKKEIEYYTPDQVDEKDKDAVAFAKWIRVNRYESAPQEFGKWYKRLGTELNRYTEEQLYKMFKEQKSNL